MNYDFLCFFSRQMFLRQSKLAIFTYGNGTKRLCRVQFVTIKTISSEPFIERYNEHNLLSAQDSVQSHCLNLIRFTICECVLKLIHKTQITLRGSNRYCRNDHLRETFVSFQVFLIF